MEKRAIVTIAIGDIPYFKYTKELQEIYATRCNAEYIILKDSTLNNRPNYEKWRCSSILEHYDRVLYLDADVMPTAKSPNIFEQHPEGFWAVNEMHEARSPFEKKLERDFGVLSDMYGKVEWDGKYFNSGVMLIGQDCWRMFSDLKHIISGDIMFTDQTRLNYLLKRHNIEFNELDPKWNAFHSMRAIYNIELDDAYFLHFYKGDRDEELLKHAHNINKEKYFENIWKFIQPYTMLSKSRINFIVENIPDIKGDFVNCGIWKGGSAMAAALAYNKMEYQPTLWLYDTYEGMTEPGEKDICLWKKGRFIGEGQVAISLDEVKRNMKIINYKGKIHYIKGDVRQTLDKIVPEKIAFLYLDTDFYDSTKKELEVLYDKVVDGGIVCVDDYGSWGGSRDATNEFCNERNIHINKIDKDGVWWMKC